MSEAEDADPMDRSEIDYLRDEVRGLTREVGRLTSELDKLRHPPHIVGTVVDRLDDGRLIVKSTTGPNFVVPVADAVKDDLEVGTRVGLTQQNLTVVAVLPQAYDPVIQAARLHAPPGDTYDDIGGLDDVIEQIRETVEYPLTRPDAYARLGIVPPKGVLLHGPPGTGKTLLARAVANASEATFLRLVGSELVQKFIGEGSRRVREAFEVARKHAPAIVFIDEIDAVAAARTQDGTSSNREVERTLMQLLAELDGFDARGEVRIIAATNRLDILDPALLRPGRFDRIVDVPMPTGDALQAIAELHLRGLALDDVDANALAARLEGCTGADVRAVCTEAGMHAARHARPAITTADFDAAIERFRAGALVTSDTSGLYA